MSSFWVEDILEQHGIHLKIIEDKFVKILVCEAQIYNFTYNMTTSELAIIFQEQDVTVKIDILIKVLTKCLVGIKKGNTVKNY